MVPLKTSTQALKAGFRCQSLYGVSPYLSGAQSRPLAAAEGYCNPPELGRVESLLSLFPTNTLEQRP